METKGLLLLLLEIPVAMARVVTVVVEEVTKVLTPALTKELVMTFSPSTLTMRLPLTGVVCELST